MSDHEDRTMNLIVDIIKCAEFNKTEYINFMNRLGILAEHEKKVPTLVRKIENQQIPKLEPPPGGNNRTNTDILIEF